MFTLFVSIAIVVWVAPSTAGAQARPTVSPATQPEDDPRFGLGLYFDALRKGDEAAAYACWFDDISSDEEQRKYIADLVHHRVVEMIADCQLQKELALHLPDIYRQAQKSGGAPPEPSKLSSAQFTVYRRLAVIKWGDDEDDGFPMVLDNTDRAHKVWKISMQQWHETTRSSVGDSMLLSGWSAKATDMTTKDVRDGKIRTLEALSEAFLRHMSDLANAEEAEANHGPSTAPAAKH
jgi:hypothetical protein